MITACFYLTFGLAFAIFKIGIALLIALCSLTFHLVFGVFELFFYLLSALLGCVPAVAGTPGKNSTANLNRRQKKAIRKEYKRELDRAGDDLEYDMLMMMEVFADD